MASRTTILILGAMHSGRHKAHNMRTDIKVAFFLNSYYHA
jgi:hypothetical protein